MENSYPTKLSIESYLDHLIKAAEIGAMNVPKLDKRKKEEYLNVLGRIEYWDFVQSADYHYFISRILFLHHIFDYAKFCGYQCIENYLKAFLKYKKQIPPNIHPLSELLRFCHEVDTDNDPFLHSENILIIIAMFEPFYELARYPVQKEHPQQGYMTFFPDDIYILDYFVLKMRGILTIPNENWDILKEGHFNLYQCQQDYPEFYKVFFADNINFTQNN